MAAFLEKSTGSEGFHQVIDFLSQSHISYALTKNPEIYISFIKQFWRTAKASTDADGEVSITTNIDGQSKTITEASLRRHIKLEDHDGITSIPKSDIFEQLALMGYQTDLDKLTFQKGVFSPQWRFLIHTLLHCLRPKKTVWEQFSSNIAIALICFATNRKYNFFRIIFEHMVINIGSPHKFLMYPRFIQIYLDMQKQQLKTHSSIYHVPSLNNKVFSNMRRVTKGYTGVEIELFPSMLTSPPPEPSPTPSSSPSRTTSSPSPSSEPSTTPTFESQPSPDAEYHVPTPNESPLHVVHSHGSDEGSLKLNELMNLVTKLFERIRVLEDDLKKTKYTYSFAFTKLILGIKKLEATVKTGKARKRARVVLSEDEEDDSSKQGRIDEDPNTYFAQDDEVVHDQDTAAERQLEDSTAGITVSTAPINISTARETHSTAGRVVYGRRSKEARKDKGKEIMTEPEPVKKSKKLLEQERLGLEEAIRLQEKIDEEERAQVARDEEIARQLLALDEERVTTDPKTTKDIDWNDPSVQKYWDKKNKPKSEAQARKNMIVYLKNQSNYKMKDFEGMSYAEIRPIFEKVWDYNHNFVPMDFDIEKEKKKPAEFQQIEKEQVELDDEKEDLKGYLDIVPREDVAEDVESLSTKYPIVDWKTYTLSENFMYYKIIRGDGSSKNYKILSEMLYDFDRQDIMELYRLVKERYSSSKPEGYDLMLWGDLHTLFEPDEESEIWKNQNEYNLISWSLCDLCGVHILLMQNGIAIHMLTEKKYPLSQEMISKMLNKRLEVDHESTQAYELLKFIRSQGRIVGNKSSSRVNTAKVPIPVTTPSETGTSIAIKMTVPSIIEEKTCKKNDVKARSLLLMALANEHQLTFDQYVDAQSMFAAIKARFGGNEATKKTQKALLKQQYENFSSSSAWSFKKKLILLTLWTPFDEDERNTVESIIKTDPIRLGMRLKVKTFKKANKKLKKLLILIRSEALIAGKPKGGHDPESDNSNNRNDLRHHVAASDIVSNRFCISLFGEQAAHQNIIFGPNSDGKHIRDEEDIDYGWVRMTAVATTTRKTVNNSFQNACKRFVMGQKPTFITDDNPNKDINIAFFNLPIIKGLRELSTSEIGRLVSVTGVVTRTSEVKPE
ncbi:ribonuclease H-like domain-containing protein [Tanacetum coccineum]